MCICSCLSERGNGGRIYQRLFILVRWAHRLRGLVVCRSAVEAAKVKSEQESAGMARRVQWECDQMADAYRTRYKLDPAGADYQCRL